MEIVAIYFIIIACSPVSLSSFWNPLSLHLCCFVNVDQAATSKVHHERMCRFQTQHISASPGVVVQSLCEQIVVMFLFCPSFPVCIFKSIVHPIFDVSQARHFDTQYTIAFASLSAITSRRYPRGGASNKFSNFGCPFLERLDSVRKKSKRVKIHPDVTSLRRNSPVTHW